MYETTRQFQPVVRAIPPRPRMEPATGFRHMPLHPHEMATRVTPTRDLFVLAHLGIPRVETASWSLTIDGLLNRNATLTLDDLKALPKRTVEAVHQCCGSPLEPAVPTRRVANVRWGGVDLAGLLDHLGIDPHARYLWSYGLDGGDFAGAHCDWYVKDLTVERLAAGDVLLAYDLNGEPLPAEHGFPLRLVVPGYYGTNSVKWLWRVHVTNRRAEGLFNSTYYNDPATGDDVAAGLARRRPVWGVAPESIIVAPAPDAVVNVGDPIEIRGWAWSFRGIASVEVSVDGGVSYTEAALEQRRGWTWQGFSLLWIPVERGEAMLSARASESGGVVQPREGARNAVQSLRVRAE